MDDMPRPTLPHLQREKSRHGKWKWYVRVGKGPRIRINAVYGSKEFMAEYRAAIEGKPLRPKASGAVGTLKWAIAEYLASPTWLAYAAETRKQMGYQYAKMVETAGDELLEDIDETVVFEGRERRSAVPSDANKYVRAVRMLFDYAKIKKWVKHNPTHGIKKLPTSKTGEGFYTWSLDDMAAFEAHWPMGTTQRLAYEIIATTGLRRGDTHKFGTPHLKNGEYTVRTSKNKQLVTAPAHPDLLEALRRTNMKGETVFLITERGTPFATAASFGTWFGKACRAAGVPGNAHGIRKKLASEVAELGKSEAQLNAFFGWAHGSRESATYVQKADRAKMARDVAKDLQKVTPIPAQKRQQKS